MAGVKLMAVPKIPSGATPVANRTPMTEAQKTKYIASATAILLIAGAVAVVLTRRPRFE